MNLKFLIAMAAALWLTCGAIAFAQEAEETSSQFSYVYIDGEEADVTAAKTYSVDTIVPVAPAFALLNIDTPQGIGAPFGGDSYLNIGQSGGGLPDIGAAARPYWTFFGSRTNSLADYREADYWEHVMARTQVSAAVARVAGEPARTGVALGLSTSLFDTADPRLDEYFDRCLTRALDYRTSGKLGDAGKQRVIASLAAANLPLPAATQDRLADATWETLPPLVSNAYSDQRQRETAMQIMAANMPSWQESWLETLNPQYDACVEQASHRYSLRDDLTFGFGVFGHADTDQNFEGIDYSGASLWVGYRHTIATGRDNPSTDVDERRALGQVNIYGRYEVREDASLPNNVISDSETAIVFASYSIEAEDGRWRASLGGSWNHREYSDATLDSRDYSRFSGSFEYNIGDVAGARDAWLEVGYGALSDDVPDEDSFGFVRIKFDTTSRSR